MGPKEEHTTVVTLNEHVVKCPLNIYVYASKLMPFSAWSRQAAVFQRVTVNVETTIWPKKLTSFGTYFQMRHI